jgi:hypothetical protein
MEGCKYKEISEMISLLDKQGSKEFFDMSIK